jgi:hypothetical protein
MRTAILSAATILAFAAAAAAQPAAQSADQQAGASLATPAAGSSAAAPAVATPAPVTTTPASSAPKATTAPPDSTIGIILSKGMAMSVAGTDITFSFKPSEGTFDAGLFTGKYWVETTKLCFDIPDIGYNACSAYPVGKKSGDAFAIETDNGPADVKIN